MGGACIAGGIVLMVLAPESPGGIALMVAGLAIEMLGIVLERRS